MSQKLNKVKKLKMYYMWLKTFDIYIYTNK